MADGSSTSALIANQSPKLSRTFAVSSLEYSKSQTSYSPSARIEDILVAAPNLSDITTFEPHTPVSGKTGNDAFPDNHHELEPSIWVGDSISMRSSPDGSYRGSTSCTETPRMRPAIDSQLPSSFHSLNDGASPHRQDSAYESVRGYEDEPSSLDSDTQARNIRARERVAILRGRVLRTRQILNENRQGLQFLRENLLGATAKLMKAIDELMIREHVQDLRSLSPLYQAARVAQDNLGPAEDNFDILELRLIREEEELEQEEMHFYTHNNIILAPLPDSKLDEPLTPLLQSYQLDDLDTDVIESENELVRQYLAKVTEAKSLKEDINELEDEQYRVLEEHAFREQYNVRLSEESKTFMFEYPQTHRDLVETLQQVEHDLYDLRDQCIDQGLFNASDYVYEPREQWVEEIYLSLDDALDRLPLRAATSQTSPHWTLEHNFKVANKRDFVNTWLLDWVQDSPVESLRLHSLINLEYEKGGIELDGTEWPTLALQWWGKDQAGEGGDELQKDPMSTVDTILDGTSISEGSLDPDLAYGHGISIELEAQARWARIAHARNVDAQTEQELVLRSKTSSASRASSV